MRIASAQDLGHYVRERRRKLDLTQAQLASRAKVSRRWLSDLEAGKETAEFGLVLRTLHTLGVIVDVQPEEKTGQVGLDVFLNQYRDRARNGRGYTSPIRRISDVDLMTTDSEHRERS
jgi:HTH-type transcriptional regulator/antitoxin HipB